MHSHVVSLALVVTLTVSSLATARTRESEAALEANIRAEVASAGPEAAKAFDDATRAREAGQYEVARTGFAEAARLAPGSSHPLRRLCHVESALKAHEAAVASCRAALALDGSPINEAALASALAGRRGPGDLVEAKRLAKHAHAVDPVGSRGASALVQIAVAAEDMTAFELAVDELVRSDPGDPETLYYAGLRALMQGDYDDAERHVARLRADPEQGASADNLQAIIDDAKPFHRRALEVLPDFLLGWLSVLALLIVGGFSLSWLVVRSAYHLPPAAEERTSTLDRLLRRTYAGLLWLACAFYYVSIPIVLAVVLALAGGLVYGMLAVGRISIQLLLFVGVTALYTTSAVVKSLFIRVKDEDPGKPVLPGEHPALDAVLDEVAQRVGTRPVDRVFMTPGTDLAVFERGSFLQRLRRVPTERCLVLGVGCLEGLALVELKAILAHEYGHFQNRDTAGGGLALAVRRSLFASVIAMAESGVARWHNPAWWFVRGFFALFLRISQGASRLQEILADRWAAHCYGADAFERGLRHVITRTVQFEAHVSAVLTEVVEQKEPLANLYRHEPRVGASDVADEIEKALSAEPSPYDSHPAPRERFRLVRRLVGAPESTDDGRRALDLFADADAVERAMTEEVRERLFASKGVFVRGPA